MIRLDESAARAALASLDRVALNTGFARAVLAGKAGGAVWVDRLSQPRAFHALHDYGMSLVWGEAVDEVFPDVVAHLRDGGYRVGAEWLQVDPCWQALDWDRQLGAVDADGSTDTSSCIRYTRVNFHFDAERFRQHSREHPTPPSWTLRPAVAADFDLAGSVVPKGFWRDAAQFLAHGGGWCAEQDGKVGAIAFTSYRSDVELELGIETFAHARRQGLGHAVAARMIRELLDNGITPAWSCRLENAASFFLAQKLGFEPTLRVPYYRLAAAAVASTTVA